MEPDPLVRSRLPNRTAVGFRSGREVNCSIPSFDGAAKAVEDVTAASTTAALETKA